MGNKLDFLKFIRKFIFMNSFLILNNFIFIHLLFLF